MMHEVLKYYLKDSHTRGLDLILPRFNLFFYGKIFCGLVGRVIVFFFLRDPYNGECASKRRLPRGFHTVRQIRNNHAKRGRELRIAMHNKGLV